MSLIVSPIVSLSVSPIVSLILSPIVIHARLSLKSLSRSNRLGLEDRVMLPMFLMLKSYLPSALFFDVMFC